MTFQILGSVTLCKRGLWVGWGKITDSETPPTSNTIRFGLLFVEVFVVKRKYRGKNRWKTEYEIEG